MLGQTAARNFFLVLVFDVEDICLDFEILEKGIQKVSRELVTPQLLLVGAWVMRGLRILLKVHQKAAAKVVNAKLETLDFGFHAETKQVFPARIEDVSELHDLVHIAGHDGLEQLAEMLQINLLVGHDLGQIL